ncbi:MULTISPECIES: site-specific integrase [unclassified Beijerinckia]|uniref:site-specific integrase n=1 Tax=unclassified Beijerinckia TaxID=2638183 RepID=UPI00089CCADF|nr:MULTISPECIES: site-specific integrase [unclassified Beijerinckia]MDH7795812.1 integrase [Beijerinckia sp. GAS462]SEC17438.1 Site-specific recombinase XerD [Beijerinckia sp. 28-YEA-48]
MDYLVRRNGTYSVRVTVPPDLREVVGKTQIWRSLKTKEAVKARRLAPIERDSIQRELDSYKKRELTPAEAEVLIYKRYTELLAADEKFRLELPTEAEFDAMWRELENEFGEYSIEAWRIFSMVRDEIEAERTGRANGVAARLAGLKVDLARGETRSVETVLAETAGQERIQLPEGPRYRQFAQHMQRAEIEALKRSIERDAGDFTGAPVDPIIVPPAGRALKAKPGETIMELYDRFHRESKANASDDTWKQNRRIMEHFVSFVGNDAHISIMSRSTIRDWKARLAEFPARAQQIAVFNGLSFAEIIEKNKRAKKPVLNAKTINRNLAAVGSFAGWLLANDYIQNDIMSKMYLSVDKTVKMVHPYTTRQIRTMLRSPLFNSCAGDGKEYQSGDVQIRDWRFWLPLIAMYSGARLGELAQMDINDLRQINGIWCFHLTTEGGRGKRIKTKGSERVVPVHPELIARGLIEYREALKARRQKKLFPELVPDARGFWSGVPSKFTNKYLRAIGIKRSKAHNVHSLRHTVADALRNAGFMDEQFGPLFGHTKATTTQKYGIVSELDLTTRRKMVEAIAY